MTKEELYELAKGSLEFPDEKEVIPTQYLDKFFRENVCIPKGEHRHPYADVLHEWIEGAGVEFYTEGKYDILLPATSVFDIEDTYRIKPSEPIYEWQYCHNSCGGKNIVADKYYTDYEYETMVDDKKRCIKLPWTKRERA